MGVSGNQSLYRYYGSNGDTGYTSSKINYFYMNFTYSEEVDLENNKSIITVNTYLSSEAISVNPFNCKIFWNDTQVVSFTANGAWHSGWAQVLFGTKTFEVTHDLTGNASGTIKVEWYPTLTYAGVSYYTVGAKTGNIALTFIPKDPPIITSATCTNTTYSGNIIATYSTSSLAINASSSISGASIIRYLVKYGDNIMYDGDSSTPSFIVPGIEEDTKSIVYSVTVYDTYNLSATLNITAFTAKKYVHGEIDNSSKLAQRCKLVDGSYVLDDEGKYAKCYCEFTNSKVGGEDITTTCIITVNSDEAESSTSPITAYLGNDLLSISRAYNVSFKLIDGIYPDGYEYFDIISVAFYTMHFADGGHGIGAGRSATDGYFDFGNSMPPRFEGYPGNTPIPLLDIIYPIGSIYMTTNRMTNPNDLFYGTYWNQIKNRFILAADDSINGRHCGDIGGEDVHTLTIDEMPAHNHKIYEGYAGSDGSSPDSLKRTGNTSDRGWRTNYIESTGGGQAHNNMPPYLAVYMWQRVSEADYIEE